MSNKKKLWFLILSFVTLFLAINGLTGRWLPNIVEHVLAGVLIPSCFYFIMNYFSKRKFHLLKLISSIILYLIALFLWEKKFNIDILYGILGIIIFIFINKIIQNEHLE